MSSVNDSAHVKRKRNVLLPSRPGLADRIFSFTLRFLILYATWLLLSGMYDPFHMILGAFCCVFVNILSTGMFPPEARRLRRAKPFMRCFIYMPWLVWEVAKANIRMLRLAFHPRINEVISPQIVTFKTPLRSKLALTMLANSITLTPGTLTMTIDERGYISVHAIDDASAAGVPGEMERKLIAIFEDD